MFQRRSSWPIPIFIIVPTAGRISLLGVGPASAVAPVTDNILINGVAVTDANFNDTTPVASAGRALMLWSRSGSGPDSVSVQTPAAVPVVLDREVTDIVVSNSTTETVIFTHSVPANAMGTNRMLNVSILGHHLNNAAGTLVYTLRIKFGGTTIFEDASAAIPASVAFAGTFTFDIVLANQDATGDQTGGGLNFFTEGLTANPTTGIGGNLANGGFRGSPVVHAGSALDTTLAQTLEVTLQMAAAAANKSFTRKMAILTLI